MIGRKRYRDKREDIICTKFAVMSTGNGCGATHMSVLVANYYAKVKKLKTAVLDFGRDNDYMSLCLYLGKGISDEKNISSNNDGIKMNGTTINSSKINCHKSDKINIGKIDFYPKALKTDLEAVFNEQYRCVILDVGDNYFKYRNEVIMCDKRFVVMQVSLWKLDTVLSIYREYFIKNKSDKWKYIFSFGDNEAVMYIREQFGVELERLPFIPDPFQIDRKQLEAVEKIILED